MHRRRRQGRAALGRDHEAAAATVAVLGCVQMHAIADRAKQSYSVQEYVDNDRAARTGDAGAAGPRFADDMTPLRRRMAGVI